MNSIDSIRAGLIAKKFTAYEIALQAIAQAQAENPKTNAYLTFSSGARSGRGAPGGQENRHR